MSQKLPFTKIDDFILGRIIQNSPYTLAVEAYQENLKRKVFIKLLKPQNKDHNTWLDRFTREAQICAKLKNPHIVDVYTIDTVDNYTYMAMEFVEGLSLKEFLTYRSVLSSELSFEIIRQVLQALSSAHQAGVIHRDVKPGNILIDISGEVKLTDFGLAYLGEEPSLTQQGNILGTPAYMAPEQVLGERLTPATDFFALGTTLYEMLTGIKPFSGENYSACIQKIINEDPPLPSEFNNHLTEAQNRFVLKLVEKSPGKRFSDAAQILQKLPEVVEDDAVPTSKSELSRLIKKYYKPSVSQPADKIFSIKKSVDKKSKKTGLKFKYAGIALVIVILFWFLWWNANRGNKILTDKTAVVPVFPDSASSGGKNSLSGSVGTLLLNMKTRKNSDSLRSELGAGPAALRSGEEKPGRGESVPDTSTLGRTPVKGSSKISVQNDSVSQLHLVVKPWAKLSIDGVVVDSMVHEKTLPILSGSQRLVLSHPEFTPKVFEVHGKQGKDLFIDYSFYQDVGYVQIEVRPWAEVYIDGKFVDTTPLDRLILLSPGQHLLTFKHPYYETYRKLLEVSAGDTIQIKQNLNNKIVN